MLISAYRQYRKAPVSIENKIDNAVAKSHIQAPVKWADLDSREDDCLMVCDDRISGRWLSVPRRGVLSVNEVGGKRKNKQNKN